MSVYDVQRVLNSELTTVLRAQLPQWYRQSRRPMPWRGDATAVPITPYSIWVSEVMSQQTRVETVVNYWNRWMERFPNVRILAEANPDEVNQLWAGLGYYRRAQNLLNGAKYIVENYGGEMPQTREELLSIPGIGPYTAGAICSIAFQQREPLVDGNVLRVFSRLFALYHEIGGGKMEKLSWKIAEELVDPQFPGDFNQALMELGATICTPTSPKCSECPVNDLCAAFELVNRNAISNITATNSRNRTFQLPSVSAVDIENLPIPKTVTQFPFKKQKKKAKELSFLVMVLRIKNIVSDSEGQHLSRQYLMLRRPETGLLANQWEFPSICLSNISSSKSNNKNSTNSIIQSQEAEILYSDEEDDGQTELGEVNKGYRPQSEDETEEWSSLWNQQCSAAASSGIITKHPIWMKFLSQLHKQTGYVLHNPIKADVPCTNSSKDERTNNDAKHDTSFLSFQSEAMHWFEEPITHIFSHERHTMYVMLHDVKPSTHDFSSSSSRPSERVQWRTETEIIAAGLTTGAKKVLSMVVGKNAVKQTKAIPQKSSILSSTKKRSVSDDITINDITKRKLSSSKRIKTEMPMKDDKSAVFAASVSNLARFLHKPPSTAQATESDQVQIKMEVIDLIE